MIPIYTVEILGNWMIRGIFLYLFDEIFFEDIWLSLGRPCTFVGWKLYKHAAVVTCLAFALVEGHHVSDIWVLPLTLLWGSPHVRGRTHAPDAWYTSSQLRVWHKGLVRFFLFLFSIIFQQARNWYMLLSFVFFMSNSLLFLLFYK